MNTYDAPKSIYIFINNLLKQIDCMNYILSVGNNCYEWFILTVEYVTTAWA